MSNPFGENEQAAKARRGRSLFMAVALLALVGLIFVVTIAKLAANAGHI